LFLHYSSACKFFPPSQNKSSHLLNTKIDVQIKPILNRNALRLLTVALEPVSDKSLGTSAAVAPPHSVVDANSSFIAVVLKATVAGQLFFQDRTFSTFRLGDVYLSPDRLQILLDY